MRRYQLSGLEHIHMMRHVPRSYDMTRTHIMHKGVNKHVDVVLRCSPKNWKKKKVTVNVVKGEKKNDAARIMANAKKGYVAVRKTVNDKFEADRKAAAAAYEMDFGKRIAGSDALIHDMKSQINTMAKKSAEYIDDQLAAKPVISYTDPVAPEVETKPANSEKPLISAETEDILKKGGYRLPNSKPSAGSPYAADYLKHASNEEFHSLMSSLEKSLDEACKKYSVSPPEPETVTEQEPQTQTEKAPETAAENADSGYKEYSGYNGGYSRPGDISLSVTKKQEIKADEEKKPEKEEEEFKPALTFTEGGEHYMPEDDLFDRELNRPGEKYVPPAYFFDDESEVAPSSDPADSDGQYVPLPDPVPLPVNESAPQDIFYTDDQDEQTEGYPREDYVQQQVFFPTESDGYAPDHLYNPPAEEEDFAEPTIFHDSDEGNIFQTDEDEDESPMVFPDTGDEDDEPPMIFPDDEDAPPPMIFPDDEEEGYSPAPVSPDRHEYYGDDPDTQGIMNRSGQTLFSCTGDQIKKVIGVIRGSADPNIRSRKDGSLQNRNVEITYSDNDN